MDWADVGQVGGAVGVVGHKEDAAGAGPELVEGIFGFEDLWGVGPEAAVPEAVDVSSEKVDLLLGVEDESRAGGEFAVEDDLVGGLDAGSVDGEGEVFGAEDGVEAGEAFMRGEEGDGHGGGQSQVRGVGASGAAQEVADGADDEHAKDNGGEGAAEEAHGVSGEVEEVAEGEVVELGVGGDKGSYVGAGGGMGGRDGEVSADDGDEGGQGDEEVEGPA